MILKVSFATLTGIQQYGSKLSIGLYTKLVRIIVGQVSFSLFDSETVPKDGWDFFPVRKYDNPASLDWFIPL